MFQTFAIFFSGFTETLRHRTGTELAFCAAHEMFADRGIFFGLFTWDQDAAELAEFIRRTGEADAKIALVGHSWGGWKAIMLAGELANTVERRKVDQLVLADAVYRTSWQPEWLARRGVPLNPVSLLKFPRLVVSDNVGEVTWFRQFVDRRIQGHDLLAAAKTTRVNPPKVLDCEHGQVDEHPAFRSAVERAIFNAT